MMELKYVYLIAKRQLPLTLIHSQKGDGSCLDT